MMKTDSLILLFIVFSTFSYSQNAFPDGVYLNVEQLKNRTPAFDIQLKISPKSKSKYKTSNFYKLESNVDSIDAHYTKFKIFAYCKNDSLLINNLNNTKYCYSLSLTKGNFLVFGSNTKRVDPELIGYTAMFGLVGAAVHTALSVPQYGNLQILSLRTGNYRPFTREYVKERLKEYPKLLEQFEKERKRISLELILKYVDLLNKTVN